MAADARSAFSLSGALFVPAGTPVATDYVSSFMNAVPPDGFDGASPLFRTIACRELWGSWQSGCEIRDGALRAKGTEVCAGARAV